jgi:hypothetical protein
MNGDIDFFFPETVILEGANGFAKVSLHAQIDRSDKIIIHGDDVVISVDDVIVHALNNGETQRYSILDVHYQKGDFDLPAITTLAVRKHGSKANQRDLDLHRLALDLERLRMELRKVASTREDDKQVALLADAAEKAEQGDADGVSATLANAGASVLKMARDIGTDVAAKVIAELMKG